MLNGHERVMELMLSLAREEQMTLVYVTHSREFADMADQVWEIHGVRIERGSREQRSQRSSRGRRVRG